MACRPPYSRMLCYSLHRPWQPATLLIGSPAARRMVSRASSLQQVRNSIKASSDLILRFPIHGAASLLIVTLKRPVLRMKAARLRMSRPRPRACVPRSSSMNSSPVLPCPWRRMAVCICWPLGWTTETWPKEFEAVIDLEAVSAIACVIALPLSFSVPFFFFSRRTCGNVV